MDEFERFNAMVEAFLAGGADYATPEARKRLLCADCDFYTPGEDEELECGCYKMLVRLLDSGRLTLEQIADVLR